MIRFAAWFGTGANMAVAITRQDVSVGDLRHEAGRTRDAKAARRMLAIACVMEGQSREAAAECCGMDRQTLRDWVHRFNADGLAGLSDLPRCCGPKPRLSPEQEARVAEWVEQGPDLARDGVVRWRCVDLQERIGREWGVSLHERTVGKLLRKLAFNLVENAESRAQPTPIRALKGAALCSAAQV